MFDILAQLAAPVIGGLLGNKGQEDANQQNAQIAKDNRDFQERMSNTSYQRAVGDMQKAGLNPMLAYSQGGASTPSGSTTHIGNAAGAGVASAQQAQSTMQGISQVQQNRALYDQVQAQTDKIKSETMSNEANTALLAAQIRNAQFGGDKTAAESETADVAARTAHRDYETKLKYGSFEQQRLKERAESGSAQLQELLSSNTFSADRLRRQADAEHSRLGLSESGASSRFYDDTGTMSKWLQNLLMVIRGASSARSIGR